MIKALSWVSWFRPVILALAGEGVGGRRIRRIKIIVAS